MFHAAATNDRSFWPTAAAAAAAAARREAA